MKDQMRELVNLESAWADKWQARAEAAEKWWQEAAPILADVSRRFVLPEVQMASVRRLMEWEPQMERKAALSELVREGQESGDYGP